jgi:hypothetical protein
MKYILCICLTLLIFTSGSYAQPNQKLMHVQICLDDIYNKYYKGSNSLENSKLLLVKNKYSNGLRNLHLHKKNFILKVMPSYNPDSAMCKSVQTDFMDLEVLKYKADATKAVISIRFVNAFEEYLLTKRKKYWKIKSITTTVYGCPIE